MAICVTAAQNLRPKIDRLRMLDMWHILTYLPLVNTVVMLNVLIVHNDVITSD